MNERIKAAVLQAMQAIADQLTEIQDPQLRRVVALRLLKETCK